MREFGEEPGQDGGPINDPTVPSDNPMAFANGKANPINSAGSATPTHPTVQVAPSVRERRTRCAQTAWRRAWLQPRSSSRSRNSSKATRRAGRPGNNRPSTETG